MSDAEKEMPRYKCHKEVWALKIKEIEMVDGGDGAAELIPVDQGYGPVPVSREYMDKHEPEAGGYYVVYEDGYKSYSPAEPFESGYTRL